MSPTPGSRRRSDHDRSGILPVSPHHDHPLHRGPCPWVGAAVCPNGSPGCHVGTGNSRSDFASTQPTEHFRKKSARGIRGSWIAASPVWGPMGNRERPMPPVCHRMVPHQSNNLLKILTLSSDLISAITRNLAVSRGIRGLRPGSRLTFLSLCHFPHFLIVRHLKRSDSDVIFFVLIVDKESSI